MRLATERIEIVDSIASARTESAACLDALHLNSKFSKRTVAAVVALLGAGAALALCRKKAPSDAMPLSPRGGVGRYVTAKLATLVLIPWLRKVMVGENPPPQEKKSSGVFGFLKRLFIG